MKTLEEVLRTIHPDRTYLRINKYQAKLLGIPYIPRKTFATKFKEMLVDEETEELLGRLVSEHRRVTPATVVFTNEGPSSEVCPEDIITACDIEDILDLNSRRHKLLIKRKQTYVLDYTTGKSIGHEWKLSDLERLPSSAKEAKLLGKTKYFSGILCNKLHVSPRNLDGKCDVCVALSRLSYYKANRDNLILQCVKNNRKRYASDPVYKAKRMSRSLVERSLRLARSEKEMLTEKYLTFTPQQLKEHCLKYITEDMFLSQGVWELDHIIPLSLFDTNEDWWVEAANSLENLMPLTTEEHSQKTREDMGLISSVKSGRKENPAILFYEKWVTEHKHQLRQESNEDN